MPQVADLMLPNDEVVHIGHDHAEALLRMSERDLPCIPVVEDDQVVGLLSRGDSEAAATAPGGPAAVRDHMSTRIGYCYATDDVATAERAMQESGHECLLVTDREGHLVGLLTGELIRRGGSGRGSATATPSGGRVTDTEASGHAGEPGQPDTFSTRPKLRR